MISQTPDTLYSKVCSFVMSSLINPLYNYKSTSHVSISDCFNPDFVRSKYQNTSKLSTEGNSPQNILFCKSLDENGQQNSSRTLTVVKYSWKPTQEKRLSKRAMINDTCQEKLIVCVIKTLSQQNLYKKLTYDDFLMWLTNIR